MPVYRRQRYPENYNQTLDKRRYPALWMVLRKTHRVGSFCGCPVGESVAWRDQQRRGMPVIWWLRHWLVRVAERMPEIAGRCLTRHTEANGTAMVARDEAVRWRG